MDDELLTTIVVGVIVALIVRALVTPSASVTSKTVWYNPATGQWEVL